jgi:hypothetical protein
MLLSTLIFGNHAFAYQIIKNVIFDWQQSKSTKSGEFQTFFAKASYERAFGLIPIYQNNLGKCGSEIINSKIVDIILEDEKLEEKISALYKHMGERLGVVSLRLAANVKATSIFGRLRLRTITPMIEEMDYIIKSNEPQSFQIGEYGLFYPRMDAINGPNIIPWSVRQKIGVLDEALAPYGYDDPEYCLRAMKVGFINGIFPLQFRSDVEWGGTRRSKKYMAEVLRIHMRNRKYIWTKHGEYIKWLWNTQKVNRSTNSFDSLESIPDCQQS